jgi:YHS domain-containing protein
VTLAADGKVHIPIEQVRDGKLHRFVWIADDGKAVRFFIINRYPDRLRLGVVFDACLLCGDQGYVMEGNQVICVACGVHIFIPSIGKAGGCNPVPIEGWSNDDNELVIGRASLAAGTNYFSTVVSMEVIDPVDGSKLTNVSAEHKYRYGGKTYFFSSEANYNRFRESPAKFATAKAAAGEPAEEE